MRPRDTKIILWLVDVFLCKSKHPHPLRPGQDPRPNYLMWRSERFLQALMFCGASRKAELKFANHKITIIGYRWCVLDMNANSNSEWKRISILSLADSQLIKAYSIFRQAPLTPPWRICEVQLCLASDKSADALLATLFHLGRLLPPSILAVRNVSHWNKYGIEDAECLRTFDVTPFLET